MVAYAPRSYVRQDKLDAAEFAEFDHPGTPARLAALREVAKDAGATVDQVVLAWLIGAEVPIIPLVGASSVAQLDESLAAGGPGADRGAAREAGRSRVTGRPARTAQGAATSSARVAARPTSA